MKRFFLIMICALFFCANLFSMSFDTEMAVMFPSTQTTYPQHGNFSNIQDPVADGDVLLFSTELKKPFSIEWCNSNFSDSIKATLASTLSPLLSKLLPCENAIFSAPELNDGQKSFRFKNLDTGDVYFVILQDSKIVLLTRV